MSKRKWGEAGFFVFIIFMTLGIFSSNAAAEMTTSFHGFFESNFVLRDQNGIQYGFFDEAYGVQQRNTLKFDVDIDPGMAWGPFSVEKVHLTYRGAYDSIFDLAAERYDIRENLGASRFDYGLKDIRFENDLREAFIDFVYQGDLGRGFFRPGRQIVSWGEGLLETLNDVINPPDQSFKLFFQNPDDVKIPLWMGRLNYSVPRFSGVSFNFDLLWIPDIRPAQFGPLDGVANNPTVGFQAPYVSCLPFADLKGFNVRQRVPTGENEWGAKVSAEMFDRLTLSLLYFRDVVNEPGIILTNLLSTPTANLTHNKQHVYGGYFSYQLLVGNFEAVVRGEVSHYTNYPINLASPEFYGNWFFAGAGPFQGFLPVGSSDGLITFTYKPVTKTMLAIDKDFRLKWLSPHDLTKVSLEWLHKTINEWDNKLDDTWFNSTTGKVRQDRRNTREQDVIMLQVMTNWWGSKLSPQLVLAYNPGKHGDGGTGMISPSIKWNITSKLYSTLAMQAFVGDTTSSYDFTGLIPTSEASISMGYEW